MIGIGFGKVGSYAFTQVLGLPYIQQGIADIIVFINAWEMGDSVRYILKLLGCHLNIE